LLAVEEGRAMSATQRHAVVEDPHGKEGGKKKLGRKLMLEKDLMNTLRGG